MLQIKIFLALTMVVVTQGGNLRRLTESGSWEWILPGESEETTLCLRGEPALNTVESIPCRKGLGSSQCFNYWRNGRIVHGGCWSPAEVNLSKCPVGKCVAEPGDTVEFCCCSGNNCNRSL
ncbi:hypothetical protein QR680_000489 [Steinernema hermaphroditum]|uniref:Activin types I and II receptor domain-containing protein n=1 Tax=Steinernema hermaphroditum TaxID=289476 RepID=A0AA39GUT3_9BILA|nr:hypothetical protein QR680_000489 [Steinernema hermaphroditum]